METKYILYVGLNDKKTKVQEITTIDAYKIAQNILIDYIGYGTIYEGAGVYTHENGARVKETTLICIIVTENEKDVQAAAHALKIALNQESIMIEKQVVNAMFI